jgi:hypothetical protein
MHTGRRRNATLIVLFEFVRATFGKHMGAIENALRNSLCRCGASNSCVVVLRP